MMNIFSWLFRHLRIFLGKLWIFSMDFSIPSLFPDILGHMIDIFYGFLHSITLLWHSGSHDWYFPWIFPFPSLFPDILGPMIKVALKGTTTSRGKQLRNVDCTYSCYGDGWRFVWSLGAGIAPRIDDIGRRVIDYARKRGKTWQLGST